MERDLSKFICLAGNHRASYSNPDFASTMRERALAFCVFRPWTTAPGHNHSHLVIPTNGRDLQSLRKQPLPRTKNPGLYRGRHGSICSQFGFP